MLADLHSVPDINAFLVAILKHLCFNVFGNLGGIQICARAASRRNDLNTLSQDI